MPVLLNADIISLCNLDIIANIPKLGETFSEIHKLQCLLSKQQWREILCSNNRMLMKLKRCSGVKA